jgi:hypothetical protein
MSARSRLLFLIVLAGGCSRPHHDKPSAAVDVKLDARALGDGRYELTLRATPTADVDRMELHLQGRKLVQGPTPKGTPLVLSAPARVHGGGEDVAGSAAVWMASRRRTRAAVLHLGPPVAPPAIRVVALPHGERVAEVRP